MFEQLLQLIVDFQWEIVSALGLVVLYFLKRRYDQNVLVASFIRHTQNAIADAMETEEPPPANENRALKQLRRAATKAKVRRELARRARKAARKKNRGTGKGSKTSNGGK
jgi:hypothetical protein